MSTPVPCQRWRARRDSYRPAGEPIRTANHEVAVLEDDATAKAFVTAHHYSGSYPAAQFRAGLFRRGLLAGVAVFSVPCSPAVLDVLPCGREAGVELGRMHRYAFALDKASRKLMPASLAFPKAVRG